ncbi:hypothetical protein ACFL6H_10475 [Candidatus Latescibacterota bacterium]
MKFARFVLFALVFFTAVFSVPETGTAQQGIEYRFLFGPANELEPIAEAGTSLNTIFHDIYFKKLASHVPKKAAPYTETAWSVFWTYTFSLWPHEFGHWARANQAGGDFVIKGYNFPFPKAEMRLPLNMAPEYQSLSIVGGFEINTLMKRNAHTRFYRDGYAHAYELIHAFIQEVYYPFYAFVVTPADPVAPSTWTDTRGDPVESTLSVFKKHTGREPIRPDGTVDPKLVDLYRETIYMNLVWTLLDPMLYESAKAFRADMSTDYGRMEARMFGGDRIAWIYGTEFNASPLGYELYFNNYLKLNGKLHILYLKTGRPYNNNGIGIEVPALYKRKNLTLGASLDYWNQDIYGSGGAVSLGASYRLYKGFGLLADVCMNGIYCRETGR